MQHFGLASVCILLLIISQPASADDASDLKRLLEDLKAPVAELAAWPELKPSSGAAFRAKNAVYVRLPEWPTGGQVTFPRLNSRTRQVFLLGESRAELNLRPEVDHWVIMLPKAKPNNWSNIILVETLDPPHLPETPEHVAPQADGGFVLPAHKAITHGEKLRFEPQPHKNTVGYWTNPEDWAQWYIDVPKPGEYELHILQGCGKGHGGSDVSIHVRSTAEPSKTKSRVKFVVKETGHFQNFVLWHIGQITIGEEGPYTLEIRPDRLAKGAVMDVREVRLVPK